MKLADALVALQLVPADPDRAITAAEFASKWRRAGQREVSTRQLHRWLPDLESNHLVGSTAHGPGGRRRYHRVARVALTCRACLGAGTPGDTVVAWQASAQHTGWLPQAVRYPSSLDQAAA